jgi:hypothetical protein
MPNTVLSVSLIQLLEDQVLHPDNFTALHWLTFAPPMKVALRSYFWEYGCSKIILLSPDCSCLTAHYRITGFINFYHPNVTICVFCFIYNEVSEIFRSFDNLHGHTLHKNGSHCSVTKQLAHPVL